jgi:hypothetical protein
MHKIKPALRLIVLIMMGIGLLLPSRALAAEGAPEMYEAEVDGYHVSLGFLGQIKTGKNDVHLEVIDPAGVPIAPKEAVILITAVEESRHEPEEAHTSSEAGSANDHAAMPGMEPAGPHTSMPGMEMDTEPAAQGEHDPGAVLHDARRAVELHVDPSDGALRGTLEFDEAGEWLVMVHFTADGRPLEVEFPVSVGGSLPKTGILAGILSLNIAIVASAAINKRRRTNLPK